MENKNAFYHQVSNNDVTGEGCNTMCETGCSCLSNPLNSGTRNSLLPHIFTIYGLFLLW